MNTCPIPVGLFTLEFANSSWYDVNVPTVFVTRVQFTSCDVNEA